MTCAPSLRRPSASRLVSLVVAVACAAGWGGMASVAAAQCELDELFASDGAAGDQFGVSVALDGARMLVGANRAAVPAANAGAAYVFEEVGGVWTETAKLVASDADTLDRFGLTVALSGDVAVVGARYDQEAGYGTGALYVFRETGGVWTEEAKLLSSDLFNNTLFGTAVWTDGQRIVVGSDKGHGLDITQLHVGSVHVFDFDGDDWIESAKLISPAPETDGDFGTSVAVSGDRILVGARNETAGVGTGAGAAYVYDFVGGEWVLGAALQPGDPKAGSFFGFDVALSGGKAVVGALVADGASPNTGAAYVFLKSGGQWSQSVKLAASDGESGDFFGTSVSISGRRVLVGAWGDDDGGASAGAAYEFEFSGGAWVEASKLRSRDPSPVEVFGHDVLVDGHRALVTSKLGLDEGGADTGSVTVFDLRGASEPYGAGCPGSGGITPVLALQGCLFPGGAVELVLAGGLGGAPALVLIGLDTGATPIGGGCTLLVDGILGAQVLLVLDGSGPGDGSVSLPTTLPPGLPAIAFALQALVGDAASPTGYSTTPGVAVTIEP